MDPSPFLCLCVKRWLMTNCTEEFLILGADDEDAPTELFSVYYIAAAAAGAASIQSCATLCDPIDGSPPGSAIPGILQARTLEWVAISFSNAWKWKVKVKLLSRVRLLATSWTAAHQLLRPWDFPGKSTGVGCHCLLLYCSYTWLNRFAVYIITNQRHFRIIHNKRGKDCKKLKAKFFKQ